MLAASGIVLIIFGAICSWFLLHYEHKMRDWMGLTLAVVTIASIVLGFLAILSSVVIWLWRNAP